MRSWSSHAPSQVGVDPMDLVRSLPGLLKDTGQALQKPGPVSPSPAAAPAPIASPKRATLGLPWKVGAAALVGTLLVLLVRTRR